MGRSLFIGMASAHAIALALVAAPAAAQTEPAAPAAAPASDPQTPADATSEDIVVTGFRRSLAEGLELKREAVGIREVQSQVNPGGPAPRT